MRASLLLDLWREVGRHLELPEFLDRVQSRLSDALPLSSVFVRCLDLPAGCVETVASVAAESHSRHSPGRTEATTAAVQALMAWCSSGSHVHGRLAIEEFGLQLLVPDGLRLRDVALVGLRPDEAEPPVGALVVGSDRSTFTAADLSLIEALAEPFAAALANDRRVREMRTLREAAEADNRALLSRLGRPGLGDVIVGADTGLRAVMERIRLVAGSDVPVLIFGETGAGKEVIARAIHSRSPRSAGPMIRVNCGAIPPELVDSELFGHERGSFTGATATRQGWFERADGGTLFLDEIGELPLAAQVRLLRILQDGTFERVGGHSSLTVHVRLVAATHRDLPSMVREGRFREDLWYRICVFPVHLPPLRDRPEDVGPLAIHFAQKAARRFGFAPALPVPQDFELLLAYPWPGNVRELASVIERAAILGEGRRLEVGKALGGFAGDSAARSAQPNVVDVLPPARGASGEAESGEDESLDTATARHITAALRASLGRIEGPFGAARRLGVNPHTLRARMRRLRIEWRRYRPLAETLPEGSVRAKRGQP
jgi:transcriptional regulator with GAF, ATPase, and Fis domain